VRQYLDWRTKHGTVAMVSANREKALLSHMWNKCREFALTAVQYDQTPTLTLKHLNVSGGSAIELIINGRPAYRLVYTTKVPGKVYILFAGKKTAQGTDRSLIETVEARLRQI